MGKAINFVKSSGGKRLVVIVVVIVAFFLGMEYKEYQIRSAIGDVFSGLDDAFESSDTKSEVKQNSPEPSNGNLNDKVSFEITKKSFFEANYSGYNSFTLKFTNHTPKDIQGVKGLLSLNDLFDDKISRVSVSYDNGIKAGESILYNATTEYNQFDDEDIKLRQTELEKIRYTFDVNTIIYSDGTIEKI